MRWTIPHLTQYVFTAWFLIKDMDTFASPVLNDYEDGLSAVPLKICRLMTRNIRFLIIFLYTSLPKDFPNVSCLWWIKFKMCCEILCLTTKSTHLYNNFEIICARRYVWISECGLDPYKVWVKIKVQLSLCFLNWAPRYEDILGEWRCSYAHTSISALDRGEWSESRPSHFIPRERAPGNHSIVSRMGPTAFLNIKVSYSNHAC
jgi:hypothetical protein